MDKETKFLSGLIELNYGEKVESKLKKLSENIPWAKGWPEEDKSFWNAEAFMWSHKINKEKRMLIKKELDFLRGRSNLDLGCGAYSYIRSVCFDFSEKMLRFNDNCFKKIIGSLESKLPFNDKEFDSVTAIFVLNYIKNYNQLFSEIYRLLADEGTLIMVLSSKGVNQWQRQKEVNKFNSNQWISYLEEAGFKVLFYEKDNLWFFKCEK